MARKYELVIVKDGKRIHVVEESNHASQMIREMEWDGYRFDLSAEAMAKRVKKANQ